MRWLPRWPCNESSPTVCHYSLSSGVPLAQADSAEVQPPSSLSPAIAHAVWIVFGRCVACPAPPCPARQAWVVERFGKFHEVLEPGLKLLVPVVDEIKYVHSLKEIVIEIPSQVCDLGDLGDLGHLGV